MGRSDGELDFFEMLLIVFGGALLVVTFVLAYLLLTLLSSIFGGAK